MLKKRIFIKNIIWVLITLIILALIETSIYIYKSNELKNNLKIFSLFLFFSTIINFLIYLFLYKRYDNVVQQQLEIKNNKTENFMFVFIKIIFIFFTVSLGVYFLHSGKSMINLVLLIAALIQVIFLFGFNFKQNINTSMVINKGEIILSNIQKASIIITFIICALFTFGIQHFLLKYMIKFALMFYIILCLLLVSYIAKIEVLNLDITSEKIEFKEIVFITFLTLIAFFIRIYKLYDIPAGCSLDEGLAIYTAGGVLKGEKLGIFLSNIQFQVTSLYYYIIAAWYKLTGIGLFNLRLFSAVIGALTVTFQYLLVRDIFNKRLAVISSIVLTFMYFHIIYSRVGWLWVLTPFFACASFYFYFIGSRKDNYIFYALSGIAAGLGLYMYNSSKLVVFIFGFYWIFLFLIPQYRKFFISNFKGIIIWVLSFLVVLSPLIYYWIGNFQTYIYWVKIHNIFAQTKLSPIEFMITKDFIDHIVSSLLMFTVKSSYYGYFNLPVKPLLDPISGLLFIFGMAYLVAGWKNEKNFFLILWVLFGISAALLSIHSYDPNSQRIILAVPAIAIIIGLSIEKILFIFDILKLKILRATINLILILCLIFMGYENLYTYFVLYANDAGVGAAFFKHSTESIKALKKNKNANKFISPYFYSIQSFAILLAAEVKNFYTNDVSLLNLTQYYNDAKKDVVIMGEGIYENFFNIFKEYFPNAIIKKYYNHDYKKLINKIYNDFSDRANPDLYQVTCYIPYKDIEEKYNLEVIMTKKDGSIEYSKIKEGILLNDGDIDYLTAKGLINIPKSGSFSIFLKGAEKSTIFLDNKIYNPEMFIAEGLHKFEIKAKNVFNKKFEIILKNKDTGIEMPVPKGYFLNSDKIFGLTAVYSKDGIYKATRIDPTISRRSYPGFGKFHGGEHMYTVTWTGKIYISEDGYYKFYANSYYDVSIYINNKCFFDKKNNSIIFEENEKFFNKGWHNIKIIYDFKGTPNSLVEWSFIKVLFKEKNWKTEKTVEYDILRPFL